VASSLAGADARADPTPADQCIAAAEQSQPLRHDGKLTEAREKLLACSRAECPSFVRTDCTKWLADLEAALPSIVPSAVDGAGGDLTDVRVSIDGVEVVRQLDGRELDIDPGAHTLRFEHPGSAPIEQKIVVHEAQRRRVVSVTFADAAAARPALPSVLASDGATPSPRRSLVLPIVLMGAGAAAVAGATYFWLSGLSDHSGLASDCAPSHSCSQSSVDSARGKLVVGDIVGGVGVVAAAIGAGILVFGRPDASSSAGAQVGVRPVAGGAVVGVLQSF
jgi:hypothetical protein